MTRYSGTRCNRWLLLAGCFVAGGCGVGNGSDVGPALPNLPAASSKVVVLDDQGRGVVGATVTVRDTGDRAITGRNGRGDLLAGPRGRRLVDVDATNGAARNGDRLGSYRVATTIVGPDLPGVLFVPDLAATATAAATIALGTQTDLTILTSAGGSRVAWVPGTSIGLPRALATIEIALGDLAAQHLPGNLPQPATGARLFSRGVFVDPADLSFTPPAILELADDLQAGAGPVRLFHLDPTSGEWGEATATLVPSVGRITAIDAVAAGGLWAFAADVAATTVSGRVVDAQGRPLPDVMVVVDQLKTVTDRNGRFVVERVAATLADGSPRSCAIELFAGGSWLPARAAATAPVAATATDVGDLTLDTVFAGNVRVQQIARGKAQAFAPTRLSTLRGDVALVTTCDAMGQAFFEDVPADYFGFQQGFAVDSRDVFYGQSIGFLERGRRWQDSLQFLQERTWYQGGRRSRTYVSDAIGGGPLFDVAVVQGAAPGQGFFGLTREGGTVFVPRDFLGRATASLRSERDGRVLVAAYTIEAPWGEHLELPLPRLRRTAVGAFDRHGLVAGTLTGATATAQHALRATQRRSVQEWWEELVEDGPAASSLPLDVDPATTHGPFVIGLPVAGGNLAAVEFTAPGGSKTLHKVAIAADVTPVEGAQSMRDLALDGVASETFSAPGALATADAELDVASLRLSLALQQPSGRIVDVVRDLQGNHAAAGADLLFVLPPLAGALAGHGWLALLDGSYTSGSSTLRCSALFSLPRGAAGLPSYPRGVASFADFPDILSPVPGATVPASGFDVVYALPVRALHGAIELRSDSPADTRSWQVLVPNGRTVFTFVTLPAEAATPLVAGRTWTLTVSAVFGDGPVTTSDDPYGNLSTFVQSIGTVERGGSMVMRRSIQIVTN